MLQKWTKHREVTKKAICKSCAARRRVTLHPLKKVWKQSFYTCSKCKCSNPPSYYDYKKLAILDDVDKADLAVCMTCESKCNKGQPVTCVACNILKNRDEFSFARQRCKYYKKWRCLTCDFPPCETCGIKPNIPKKAPYTCNACIFPPCKCGAKRPRTSKYRSTNKGMLTWTCRHCRKRRTTKQK